METVHGGIDPAGFLARAEPLLAVSEARHNLIYGIAGTMVRDPGAYESFSAWLVERDGAPVAAALRTPPYNAIVSDAADAAAVAALAHRLAADQPDLPGVTGNVPAVGWFVEAWSGATGAEARLAMAQGVFVLEDVVPPSTPPGRPRRAMAADISLVCDWYAAFVAEAAPDDPAEPERIRTVVTGRIEGRNGSGVWLWERDGRPVAFSGHGGATPNGVRIGPVYTPPAHRRHGYASALVAHQSAELLREGRRFCFLYTDLANPTSNAIYRRIGYAQVAESAMWRFSAPA